MLLQKIMSNYLNESFASSSQALPVKPSFTTWEVSEKNLKRLYEFKSRKIKEAFIVEILKYLRESEADIEFRARKNNVLISIHAYSPSVSELELEASKDIDKIKKDVAYYFAEKE